mmetsp:Transcript_31012/g.35328  ORF Transcript_31012/g.35328 Transcript_31012/m.35328 type:complete len:186 (+) Transcript_31012:68-625(+)
MMKRGLNSMSKLFRPSVMRNISVGDKFPAGELSLVHFQDGEFSNSRIQSEDYLKGKTVVIVSYPGAFTPVCTSTHLPEFIERADEIKSQGVDDIMALAVNDPWVVKGYAKALEKGKNLTWIADGLGKLTKDLEFDTDLSAAGLGVRGKRGTFIVKDGVVTHVNDEESTNYTDIASTKTILEQVKN